MNDYKNTPASSDANASYVKDVFMPDQRTEMDTDLLRVALEAHADAIDMKEHAA